jgi:hypothetical protein
MAAVTLILLLACTHVTMLLLSRAAARRDEMGVRLSMGAIAARSPGGWNRRIRSRLGNGRSCDPAVALKNEEGAGR